MNKNTGTHWVVLFGKSNKNIYFDSFGVEYLPKEIKKFIEFNSVKDKKHLNKFV